MDRTRVVMRDLCGLVDDPLDKLSIALAITSCGIGWAGGFTAFVTEAKGQKCGRTEAILGIIDLLRNDYLTNFGNDQVQPEKPE